MEIFFSVGEPSGDLHAAKLVTALRERERSLRCTGFGGPLMEQSGCSILFRLTDLAVMGLFDVIPLLWKFICLAGQARRYFDEHRPDAVVLVDFPGFNWWIARAAKKRGIPVFYYLPPQLWAWGGWRVRKMRRFVDLVLCCLPFERDWYQQRGVPARLVGHPFFDEVASRPLDRQFLDAHCTPDESGRLIIGILPGSRNHEIALNFDVQLEVMARLHREFPRARFLVASYRESQRAECERKLADSGLALPVEFHVGRTSEIIELAHVCLMVSGSVSLELLARETPAVVLYRSGPVHYALGRLLVRCPYISLPNLIAGKLVMPEFVVTGQAQKEVGQMTEILQHWLAHPAARADAVAQLRRVRAEVAVPGATSLAAATLLEQLATSRTIATDRRFAA